MIVAGVPALAVNEPVRLVVIPTLVPPPPDMPVNCEPSPTNALAVTTPTALTPPLRYRSLKFQLSVPDAYPKSFP